LRRTRRRDRWYLAGALLILLAVTFLSYQDWSAFQRSAPLVQHNRQLLQDVEDTMSSIRDAESGQRGFLLTGDPEYLDAYNAAVGALPAQLRTLRAAVANEPVLRTRVETLSSLISEKLSELKETVALRQAEGFQTALTVVQSNRGKHAMDDIRKIGVDTRDEVYNILLRGIRERQIEATRTRVTATLGAAVLFVFLLLATFQIGHDAAERDHLIVDLASANERTTASRDLLHTTLTSIAEAVVTTDESGGVTLLNGVAEGLTGWTQAKAQGVRLEELFKAIDEETRQPVENPVTLVLRGDVPGPQVNQLLLVSRTGGAEIPIESSVAPIRSAQGRIIGAVLVFRDVTGRRESEAQLRGLNRDLKEINEDLQQFSYAASHDLKEPLRTVTNYLQLIRLRFSGKVLDSEAAKLFDIAVAGAQRMHALVEALLDYSRTGEVQEGALQAIPADRIVRDAVGNLQSSVSECGAEIVIGELPVVRGNSLHLTQLFENLIGNALKYRSAQAPSIAVKAEESGQEWIFSVEDNGIGIPREYQAQIFGIFKRLHGDEYPGTGIGLATCKKIVERHGGAIWVESEAGQGAKFCFTLPRTAAHASKAVRHGDRA
jgi:PAS domain S-box-containing protein